MNRSDLESKVRISVGPSSPGGRTEMVATLEVKAAACLDPYVMSCAPAIDLPRLVEKTLRECVVGEVLGDQEAENRRLRAAVDKWARRAMAGSMSRQIEPNQWSDELKEDLQ